MILNAVIIGDIIYKNLARECTHFGKYGVNCYFQSVPSEATSKKIRYAYLTRLPITLLAVPNVIDFLGIPIPDKPIQQY